MMDSIVEKVAKAMCAASDDDWDWSAMYIILNRLVGFLFLRVYS